MSADLHLRLCTRPCDRGVATCRRASQRRSCVTRHTSAPCLTASSAQLRQAIPKAMSWQTLRSSILALSTILWRTNLARLKRWACLCCLHIWRPAPPLGASLHAHRCCPSPRFSSRQTGASPVQVSKVRELEHWQLYLVDWGYNTAAERKKAAQNSRINILDKTQFQATIG